MRVDSIRPMVVEQARRWQCVTNNKDAIGEERGADDEEKGEEKEEEEEEEEGNDDDDEYHGTAREGASRAKQIASM